MILGLLAISAVICSARSSAESGSLGEGDDHIAGYVNHFVTASARPPRPVTVKCGIPLTDVLLSAKTITLNAHTTLPSSTAIGYLIPDPAATFRFLSSFSRLVTPFFRL